MKSVISAIFICCLLALPAYSQTPKVISAQMYSFKGTRGTHDIFDSWSGTVDENGVFKSSSHVTDVPVKSGSDEAVFKRTAAGYSAWCVVDQDSLKRVFGRDAYAIYTRNGVKYSTVTVLRVIED